MATKIRLRMDLDNHTIVHLCPSEITGTVLLQVNDREVIAQAPLDLHECDMLIALLSAAKAGLRQQQSREASL